MPTWVLGRSRGSDCRRRHAGLGVVGSVGLWLVVGGVRVLAQDYHVQNWRKEDGLPDGQVSAIVQTPDGYLWIGSAKGLARFDGVRFKVFHAGNTREFTDSRISSLTTDREGSLWVGMLDGSLVRRQLKSGFTEMQPPESSEINPDKTQVSDTWLWDRRAAINEEAEGISRSYVEHPLNRRSQLIVDGEGAVWWHVSGLRLMRYQAGQWSVFTTSNGLPPGTLRQMACDHDGRLCIEVTGRLYVFQGNRFHSSDPPVALAGTWHVLTAASKGGLWIADPHRRGVGRVQRCADGQWADSLSPAQASPRAARDTITTLLEDRARRIWYGTVSGAVFFFDSQGHWQCLRPQSSFSQGYISCLFEDQLGSIWVGTVGDGIYRLTQQPITMFKLPPPFENAEVNTTCATRDGAVWMGTGGSGALRYADSKFTAMGIAEGLANLHVCALFEDSQSNLWAGTASGLFRWVKGRFIRAEGPSELSNWVAALFEDHTGKLWIGTHGGLICLENGKYTVHHLRPDQRECDIRSLAEDPSGNLWIGTIGQGLFCIPAGQAGKLYRVENCPLLHARALYCAPDGILWIGGWGGGLVRMDHDKFTTFTTTDGLPSDRIQSITSDVAGRLWLSSDNGVIGISPQTLQNYQRGQSPPIPCQHLSLAEGLANGICSGSGQPTATRAADGRLWFPNYEGVAMIDPRKLSLKFPAPGVLVEAVLADGKELALTADNELQSPSGVKRFEFDYTAPNLSSQRNLRFRYKLVGMDPDWVDGDNLRVAYYSQLPPGQYQFHVMVGDSDNQWHAADRVINLRVVPRFWEQRWLQILASGLIVAILGGGITWRQRRKYKIRLERSQMQNAMENERRRISRDLHDEFGSSLTGIALQGEAFAQGGTIPAAAKNDIISMTRRVRQLIGALDEVVWATDPGNDSLANVVAFLSDYAEGLLAPSAIHHRLEAPSPPELPMVSLNAETRHNLFLAVKEALNNSVRHSDARTIWLRIRLEANLLVVEIADDGHGFEPSKVQEGGNGLTNINYRMKTLHGRAEIESQPGLGTTVRLVVPLPGSGKYIQRNNNS